MTSHTEPAAFSAAEISILSDLICEIYTESLTADAWTTILQLVGRVVGYRKARVLCLQPDQPPLWIPENTSGNGHEPHEEHHRDAGIEIVARALERGLTVWRPTDAIEAGEWERTGLCDHLQMQGLGDMITVSYALQPEGSVHIGLARDRMDSSFAERDIFLLRRIRHHFIRSSHLRKTMHDMEAAAATFRQIMRPGYICDSEGRILEMNKFGRRLIEDSEGSLEEVQTLIEEAARRLIDTGENWCHIDIFGDKGRLSVHPLTLKNPPERSAIVLDSYEYFRRVIRHRMQDYGLTPREIEICTLLVQGMSNRDVADMLFIAESTVKEHMTSILGKFDVVSRNSIVPKLLGYDTDSLNRRPNDRD